MLVQVYRKRELIAKMTVDLAAKTVSEYRTYINDVIDLPFEVNRQPNYIAFVDFLESRCPPRE